MNKQLCVKWDILSHIPSPGLYPHCQLMARCFPHSLPTKSQQKIKLKPTSPALAGSQIQSCQMQTSPSHIGGVWVLGPLQTLLHLL